MKQKHKDNKKISIWELNNTKDNQKIWKDIKKNDILLFLRNGKIFSKAKIIYKNVDLTPLGSILKNNKKSPIDKLFLYFYDNEKINIDHNTSYSIFMNPLMPDVYDFPILKIDDKKISSLIKAFDDIEEMINFLGDPKNKDKSISEIIYSKKLKNSKVTSKKILKKQRTGQEKFRKNILRNFHNKCAVCGNEEIELLQAAHIIPVYEEEKAGLLKNGICLCVLCHMLFDKGYFSFDEKLRIIFSTKKKIDKVLKNIIKEKKKIGTSIYPPSLDYLAAHRAKFEIFNY